MQQKIIVMGGSFNPPTLAHQTLMLTAMEALQADRGIFVPSSHEYVKRKMERTDDASEVLDADLRLRMLTEMVKDDPRLSVDDHEYHVTEKSRTFDTLVHLQARHPDAELYFLAGGDKLEVLPRWYRIRELLEQFRVIVTDRGDRDVETTLSESPLLRQYRHRIAVIPHPAGIGGISSSAVRRLWRAGAPEDARAMLHPAVYELMVAPHRCVITTFRGQHAFLSNFFEAPVAYGGLTYQSAEAAFQAQKCMTEEEKRPFTAYTPSKAKHAGRRVALRPDWEAVKCTVMAEIVYAKFSENETLKRLLLDTGDALLKEGNTWGDLFWGVSLKTGRGQNNLGIILMQVREGLRS